MLEMAFEQLANPEPVRARICAAKRYVIFVAEAPRQIMVRAPNPVLSSIPSTSGGSFPDRRLKTLPRQHQPSLDPQEPSSRRNTPFAGRAPPIDEESENTQVRGRVNESGGAGGQQLTRWNREDRNRKIAQDAAGYAACWGVWGCAVQGWCFFSFRGVGVRG